jgi:hypothetical protein
MTRPPNELPAGSHHVCPRCGTRAREGVWCEGCGLNLPKQGELPTADAYSARVREQRWLEARAEEERDRRRAEAEEHARVAEERAHEQGERILVEKAQRHAEAGRRREEKRERRESRIAARRAPGARRRRRFAFLSAGILVALGAGAAIFALTREQDTAHTKSATARESSADRAAARRDLPPECRKRNAERELRARDQLDPKLFSGVGHLICRDFTRDGVDDMAFTRASTGTQGSNGWGVFIAEDGDWTLPLMREDAPTVGIKATGRSILRSVPIRLPNDANCCPSGGADVQVFRYFGGEFRMVREYTVSDSSPEGFYEKPAGEQTEFEECGALPGPMSNNFFDIEAKGIDCQEAMEVVEDQARGRDTLGFACSSEQTGYESSAHICTRGNATVRFASGA